MLSSDGGRSTISRPEEPLTAGNLTLTACVAGTKRRSTLRVWPGCSALRLAGGVAFFPPAGRVVASSAPRRARSVSPCWGRPAAPSCWLSPAQRQGVSCPNRDVRAERQHLLGHRRRCAVGRFRSPTGEFGQPREALRLEARLPVVERPAAHMSCATGRGDMAGRLPGFKQQLALLCRSQWKVNVFGSHTAIIAGFGDCSKCAGPLHFAARSWIGQSVTHFLNQKVKIERYTNPDD